MRINKNIINSCYYNIYKKYTKDCITKLKIIINIKDKFIVNQENVIDFWRIGANTWKDKTNYYQNLYRKWFNTYNLPFIIRLRFLFNRFCLTNEIVDKYCNE